MLKVFNEREVMKIQLFLAVTATTILMGVSAQALETSTLACSPAVGANHLVSDLCSSPPASDFPQLQYLEAALALIPQVNATNDLEAAALWKINHGNKDVRHDEQAINRSLLQLRQIAENRSNGLDAKDSLNFQKKIHSLENVYMEIKTEAGDAR
jgi:hypothetical protein